MISIVILTVTGIVMALAIGLVAKYFGTEVSPKAEKLLELLPGANCGGCGFAGCADYVQAMVSGKAVPGICPSMTSEKIAKASEILGVAAEQKERKVAVVLCAGDQERASSLAFYNGVTDCLNASLTAGGGKFCSYGCLGLGSCSRVCPFGAIEITPARLAVIHPDVCVGCGKCQQVCPRHIIKLVPKTAKVHVLCSSPDSIKVKKSACKAACIGCRKCMKEAAEGQITMNGFLATINYDNPPAPEIADKCPVGAMKRL